MNFLLFTLAASSNAAPAFREDDFAMGAVLLKILLFAGILLALTYGFLLLARRMGWIPATQTRGNSSKLSVIESRRIGTRTTIHVVRHGSQHFLLAESASNIELQAIRTEELPLDEPAEKESENEQ